MTIQELVDRLRCFDGLREVEVLTAVGPFPIDRLVAIEGGVQIDVRGEDVDYEQGYGHAV